MKLTRKNFVLGTLATASTITFGCGDSTGTGGSGGGSGGESAGGAPEGGSGQGGTPSNGGGGAGQGGTPANGGAGEGGAGGMAAGLECTEMISANHGHELVVSEADVLAAADKTYDITGTSMHSHSVTITAAQFGMLAQGTSVMVTSTSGGNHTHTVTVTCA